MANLIHQKDDTLATRVGFVIGISTLIIAGVRYYQRIKEPVSEHVDAKMHLHHAVEDSYRRLKHDHEEFLTKKELHLPYTLEGREQAFASFSNPSLRDEERR
ncbi:MAG: hypothetical protein Q7R56_02360, partial [Nanoarchaeota archaeon]|nr:hypothetical protein [Nanoarchaeota archaeon]